MRAIEVIVDAYERCNRLSPGETLSGEDVARGLKRLNLIVDELSANQLFLFREVLTSAVQTGNITLGAGAWAAIKPGEGITSLSVDGNLIPQITTEQYNGIYSPNTQGHPTCYAYDGFSNLYFYPIPMGQKIQIQTGATVSAFADAEQEYTLPLGYKSYLGAALAVSIAPVVIGRIPPELERGAMRAKTAITVAMPPILDVCSYASSGRRNGGIWDGFNGY